MFVLVNVAVQLDRETQRHPCLNAPGGRDDQLTSSGGHNVPKSAEVAPVLQEADGLAESCDIQKQRKDV